MNSFYDSDFVTSIQQEMLVLDTNILSSLATDKEYLETFLSVFEKNIFLIDPIVRVEFLRGSFKTDTYKEQLSFLSFERFNTMRENHLTENKVYEKVFDIARIYSHQGNPTMPLGDIFITARLSLYTYNVLFITRDYEDFHTLLFDRLGIVSLERKLKNREHGAKDIVEHLQILRFNTSKFNDCLDLLP